MRNHLGVQRRQTRTYVALGFSFDRDASAFACSSLTTPAASLSTHGALTPQALGKVPFYYHAKFAALLWLQLPQTRVRQQAGCVQGKRACSGVRADRVLDGWEVSAWYWMCAACCWITEAFGGDRGASGTGVTNSIQCVWSTQG